MINHHGSVRSRVASRFLRHVALFLALLVAAPALVAVSATPAAAQVDALRVLLFYKPNFHASHVQARQAIRDLAGELGTQYGVPVEITETDDASVFTPENLATFDTLAFAQTGGVLFNDAQRAALEGYIRGGGGFMGVHYTGWSVGTSEHDVNPFYLGLVGAMSEGHPEGGNLQFQEATVRVTDTSHPLTQDLPESFTRTDEWYDWVLNPTANVRTLLKVDELTYQEGEEGSSHPVTWCQEYEGGRSWYSSMGHDGSYYAEPEMRTQMRNGLAYTAGLLGADCSPPEKDEFGAWSPVTPWPLMPINAALTAEGLVQSFGSLTSGTDADPYDWSGNGPTFQNGAFETDVWDPSEPRTLDNLRAGIVPNNTYTDLFCSIQVQDSTRRVTMTVGGDDGLGENAPNDGSVGVTSYSTRGGLQTEAPMNYPRWYPTATTMPSGDIVVQGGSLRGGPGGPGVLTPERYTPDSGNGWTTLTGATSEAAYGDGGAGLGPDENRWWYPRAFVAPNGNLFNISGTQMFELDPSGDGALTLRGTLGAGTGNQGELGNPVGATSTAVMYQPGKILQVGGGWWANGGGPEGARAGFTVDLTTAGGTAAPVVQATQPMEYRRHWGTSTVLPDGDVLVTGGGVSNNGAYGVSTVPEIWDPETGDWSSDLAPQEHARLYHSTALLLPDGRVMVGGGGAPGPRNYTDVEFFSPPVPVRRERARRAARNHRRAERDRLRRDLRHRHLRRRLPGHAGPQRVGHAQLQQRPELPGPGVRPGRRWRRDRHRAGGWHVRPAGRVHGVRVRRGGDPVRGGDAGHRPRGRDGQPDAAGRRPVRVPPQPRRVAWRQPADHHRRGAGRRPHGAVDDRERRRAGARRGPVQRWARSRRLPPRPRRGREPAAHDRGPAARPRVPDLAALRPGQPCPGRVHGRRRPEHRRPGDDAHADGRADVAERTGSHLRYLRRDVHPGRADRDADPRGHGQRGHRRRPRDHQSGPGSAGRPGPLRVRRGRGHDGGQHRHRRVDGPGHAGRRGRLDAGRRVRLGPRPAGRQRQLRRPARQPAGGRGGLLRVDVGQRRRNPELDAAVPDRQRHRQLLHDPVQHAGRRSDGSRRDLQGARRPRPGAGARRRERPRPHHGRVEPRGLHPPGFDRDALPERRAGRQP